MGEGLARASVCAFVSGYICVGSLSVCVCVRVCVCVCVRARARVIVRVYVCMHERLCALTTCFGDTIDVNPSTSGTYFGCVRVSQVLSANAMRFATIGASQNLSSSSAAQRSTSEHQPVFPLRH